MQLDVLLEESKTCPALQREFADLLEPVILDSPKAQALRENYRRQLEWEDELRHEEVLLQPPPQERVAVLLEKFEQGDLDAWWRLNMELTLKPTSRYYGDGLELNLTTLPGWQEADATTRGRIVEAASRYVLGAQPLVSEWLGKNLLDQADFAGYRALRLLAQERPGFLGSLAPDVWQKWAQVIVGSPTPLGGSDDKVHQELVELAYWHASGDVIAAMLVLIDNENRDHEWISIHGKLDRCWDAQLSAALSCKVRDPNLKPSCMGSLLEPLLKHSVAEAKTFAESLVTVPLPRDGPERKRAVEAATMLLAHAEDGGWGSVWPPIQADDAFGHEVISAVADRHDQQHVALMTQHLSEEQIGELYLWLLRHYPPSEDPQHDGFHWMGLREGVARFRDAVLRQLQSRGTPAACQTMEQLAAALPELSWLRWAVVETRTYTLRRTWVPPQPDQLLEMARDRDFRLVENGEQLLNVVMESLQRLEQELQGENPAALDLWDKLGKGVYRPKDEKTLSDYIVRHLRRDVQRRGIVANREVEIRRGEGDAQGEHTDILIDAVALGRRPEEYDRISVIVEVKGCWNPKLKKDMEEQLRDRYLAENQSRYGLYLVGWFPCAQWDADDYRKGRTPRMTLEEARQFFDGQAATISQESLCIRALVLNATLR